MKPKTHPIPSFISQSPFRRTLCQLRLNYLKIAIRLGEAYCIPVH
jgi:hypothetical protein